MQCIHCEAYDHEFLNCPWLVDVLGRVDPHRLCTIHTCHVNSSCCHKKYIKPRCSVCFQLGDMHNPYCKKDVPGYNWEQ